MGCGGAPSPAARAGLEKFSRRDPRVTSAPIRALMMAPEPAKTTHGQALGPLTIDQGRARS